MMIKRCIFLNTFLIHTKKYCSYISHIFCKTNKCKAIQCDKIVWRIYFRTMADISEGVIVGAKSSTENFLLPGNNLIKESGGSTRSFLCALAVSLVSLLSFKYR